MNLFRLLLLVTFLFLSSCTVGIGTRPQGDIEIPESEMSVREELSFGSDIYEVGTVSEEDWQQFLGEVVTPRFPEGFTVLSGYGQYMMKNGEIVKEQSWTIIVHLPALTIEKDRAIEEIIAAYKQRFKQESVLRATSKARVRLE